MVFYFGSTFYIPSPHPSPNLASALTKALGGRASQEREMGKQIFSPTESQVFERNSASNLIQYTYLAI